MDIENLKAFLTYAESNCDSNCHKILGIPRSTLWQKINALEKEMNIELVIRKRVGVSLTEAGNILSDKGRSLLENYEKVYETLHKGEYLQGEIKLSITQAMATGWALPGFKEFLKSHPDIKLNLIVADNLQKEIELSSDILLRPLPPSSEFIKHWYVEYHHGLYASEKYLEEYGTPQSPEDLKNHRVLGYGSYPFTYFKEVNWHLNGHHGLPRLSPNLQINSTPGLFQLANLGAGIISCPVESLTLYHKGLVRILPEVKGPTIRTYFATNPNSFKTTLQKIELIKKFIEKYLKKYVTIVYVNDNNHKV